MFTLIVCDIGRKKRIARTSQETADRTLPRLDVVIAHRACVISHQAAHFPNRMRPVGLNMIKEISLRSALDHVTSIKKHDRILSITIPLLRHESVCTLQATLPFLSRTEVVGEVTAMNVCGEENMKRHEDYKF